jgi:hypothetical protein
MDMDSVNKNCYFEPDLKMVRPKQVTNDQKIYLAGFIIFFGLFFVEKNGITCHSLTYKVIFSTKDGA